MERGRVLSSYVKLISWRPSSMENHEMTKRHSVLPVTIGAVMGVVVMVVANQAGHGGDLLSLGEYLSPRGVRYGVVVAALVFLIAKLLITSRRARSWGYLLAAIVTGLVGLLALSWNVAWGVPPTSLEGGMAVAPRNRATVPLFSVFQGIGVAWEEPTSHLVRS